MIVIPMAGLSSRFFKAGYNVPKYMLSIGGKSLFKLTVESFKKYFLNSKFVFIVREDFDTPHFVVSELNELGIKNYEIVVLSQETKGQAETVYLGLQAVKPDEFEDLTIFNIDTIRPNFEYPDLSKLGDGYLEVFEGSGDNWSFAKPICKDSTVVDKTAEKNPISNLCSTGLYHFKSILTFINAYNRESIKNESELVRGELYIAPLYNQLINEGYEIHYNLIDKSDVVFSGTPSEYEELVEKSERAVE